MTRTVGPLTARTREAVGAIRTLAFLLVLSACARADVIPPIPDADGSWAIGVILTFEHWPPPKGEAMELLLRTLRDAGLEAEREFPRFNALIVSWDEWRDGSAAEQLCLEIMRDNRTSSLLETCYPDFLLHPDQATGTLDE